MSIKIMCLESLHRRGMDPSGLTYLCLYSSFLLEINSYSSRECPSDDSSLSLLPLPSVVDIGGPCTLPFSDAWWVFLSPSLLSMLVQLWASTPRPS